MSVEGNAASTYELRGKLSGVFSNIIDNTLTIEGASADAKATGDAISGKADSVHKHSASDINSGILPFERGGTGASTALVNAPVNAIIRKPTDGNYLYYTATNNGAFFATSENGLPKFGTLPVAQGGTGATSAANARKNLGVGTNQVFNKLTDIGITTFPTTMKTVVNSMPNNSTLMLDSRDIISGGTHEISDLGVSYAGIYMFMRGNSNARVSLLHIYGATGSTATYMNFGCYAATPNKVIWREGDRTDGTYPDCHYYDGDVKEWINPPMLVGTEYQTTERYKGKPVFAKVVSLDLSTGAGNKYVAVNGSMTAVLSMSCYVLSGTSATHIAYVSGISNCFVNVDSGNFFVNSGALSGHTAYALVKYTK